MAANHAIAVGDSGRAVFFEIKSGNGTFSTGAASANTGDGLIGSGSVVDPSQWIPDNYEVNVLAGDAYEVRDGGGALITSGAYVSGQPIAFSGIEIAIQGAPLTGDTFNVSASAHQDLFTTVENIAQSLLRSTASPADNARLSNELSSALANIDRALDNVLAVRSSVGARLNAAGSEREIGKDFEVQMRQAQSEVRDVDLTEAISQLTQRIGSLQAAQASFARVQSLSLFDFI